MRSFSPWTVRRVCRWSGLALAVMLLLTLLPVWWAVHQADPSVADGVCHRTRGCDQAYFCPSNVGSWRPHLALCVEGAFSPQEVDSAGWHDTLLAALPDGIAPWLPDTVTVRWIAPSWRSAP